MENEHLMILDLVGKGRISVVEAVELIEAIDEAPVAEDWFCLCAEDLSIEVNLN